MISGCPHRPSRVEINEGREHRSLLLRDEFVPGQLLAAVAAASRDEASLGRRGIGIPCRLRDGTPGSINVMPLERRSLRMDIGIGATAAVFIGDASAPIQLPAGAMRLLYNLTPAEQHWWSKGREPKTSLWHWE